MIVPGLTPEEATGFEALREAISQLQVETNGQRFGMTISIGVSSPQSGSSDLHAMLSEADRHLYISKASAATGSRRQPDAPASPPRFFSRPARGDPAVDPRPSTSSGKTSPSTWAWNRRMSNLSPRACFAFSRSAMIFSSPIL
jgi:GGDEF domain-containing protein